MKQSKIKVGEVYETKVAGNLVLVVVTAAHEPDGYFSERTTFTVRRKDTGTVLPKRRTAAALRAA